MSSISRFRTINNKYVMSLYVQIIWNPNETAPAVALSFQTRNEMLRSRTQRNGKYFVISAKKHKIITDQFFPPVILASPVRPLSTSPHDLPAASVHHLILMSFDISTYDSRQPTRVALLNFTFCFRGFSSQHSAVRSYDVHFSINHKSLVP